MGRIRSIKPTIIEDEIVSALPHLEWRLFVSLFVLADDYGNLHGAPAKIRGSALWATDVTDEEVCEALARLSRDSLIVLYTVRGQVYVSIRGWSKHQRVDHPGKPLVPSPDQADTQSSRDSRETLAKVTETLAPDKDKDKDRDKEKECAAKSPHIADPLELVPDDPPKPDRATELAEACCDALNAATGSRYRPDADGTRKLAVALAKAGRTVDEMERVVADRVDEWRDDPRMASYLRPATILAAANFAKYLDDLDSRPPVQRRWVVENQVY